MFHAQRRTKRARARRGRRGATIVEMSIMMTVFLACVLAMLDLGIAVFRYHLLSEAARHAARQACVHGRLADRLGPWGPAAFTVQADDPANPMAAAVRPLLVGLELDEVTIQAQWPDGGNDSSQENRVRVTVQTAHRPVSLFLFGAAIPLQASSTMVIMH